MALIDCSEFLESIEIGKNISFLPTIILDEGSFNFTSNQMSGRGLVEYSNNQYSANWYYYGQFDYTSINSYEQSKISSVYLTIDGLNGFSIRDFSLKVTDFLLDPNDFENLC